jgi:hypothetical protein
VLHDLHLPVDRLLAVHGQRLAGELLAAGLGVADPDGAELPLPNLGAELVLALEALLPAHPRGGLDAAQLPLQPAGGAVRRLPPIRRRRRHHNATAPAGTESLGGPRSGELLILLGPRLGLAAGADMAKAGLQTAMCAGMTIWVWVWDNFFHPRIIRRVPDTLPPL